MGQASLENALKDFGAVPRTAPAHSLFDEMPEQTDFPAFAEMESPAEELPDVDMIVAAAVGEAEAALAERLGAEHQAELEAERERHIAEIAELEARLSGEAGAVIAQRIQDMEERVAELSTSVVARILGVALTEDLRRRSVEKLSQIVADALHDGEGVRIRVRGAQSLYDALCEALPAHAANLDFTEAPGIDLWVTIDDSAFETRLSEWSSMIGEVLS